MLTEKELLKLAGKLALACEQILISNPKTLSENIKKMEIKLNEYNYAIEENLFDEEINETFKQS